VEGYTDVISLFQSGIENVVSSSGTSLTTGQIKLIKRYTQNITILYDGDAAGIKASFRGIDMIVEEGLNVRVVLFPEGEDPDSYARSHSAEELTTFLDKASQDFIHFKADLLSKEAGKDPVKKAGVVREIVQTIALVPEQLNRVYLIRETSELLDIKEEILTNEVAKQRRKKFFKEQNKEEYIPTPTETPSETQVIPVQEGNIFQEKEIIRLLLNYGNLDFNPLDANIIKEAEETKQQGNKTPQEENIEDEIVKVAIFILEELIEDEIEFEDPILQKIFSEYVQAFNQETIPSEQFFVNHPDEQIRYTAVDLLTQQYSLSPLWLEKHKISTNAETNKEVISRAIISSLYSIKSRTLEKRKSELIEKAKDTTDENERANIMLECINIDKFIKELNSGLGRIIHK
jgi:DNA primase